VVKYRAKCNGFSGEFLCLGKGKEMVETIFPDFFLTQRALSSQEDH